MSKLTSSSEIVSVAIDEEEVKISGYISNYFTKIDYQISTIHVQNEAFINNERHHSVFKLNVRIYNIHRKILNEFFFILSCE